MIDVLLATFRPNAVFLEAQVDSILGQRDVAVNLICREDSKGLGAASNFSALLSRSLADYVALSDQDDVWCPEKLSKSLTKLKELEAKWGVDMPLLVFCDGWVTDETLKPLPGTVMSRQGINVEAGLAFSRLLVQNFVAGNSVLFNAALRKKAGEIPKEALMHDAWLVLVAAAFGHIGFVDEPLYCYRQHDCNAIGATKAGSRHFLKRACEGAKEFRARLTENAREAQAFADRFGAVAPEAARVLAGLPRRCWLARRYLILRYGLIKQGFVRNLALMLAI